MKTKKLVLKKNTTKSLTVQTNIQTGVPGYSNRCGGSARED